VQEGVAEPVRQVAGEDGEHGAVRLRQLSPGTELTAQHRHLVPQREQLDISCLLPVRENNKSSPRSLRKVR